MNYLLGIDVGTTGAKAALFDEMGRFIDVAGCEYDLHHPDQGYVEQNPEDWWKAVVESTREVVGRHPETAQNIVGLGLSSQGGCTLPIDSEGRPLREAISWMDVRTKDICEKMSKDPGQEFIYKRTGWSLSVCFMLTQIQWLREHYPDAIEKASTIFGTLGYTNMKLTGRIATDPSNAAITQLFSLKERDWSDELLAYAGVPRSKMPEIIPSGQPVGKLTAEAAAELGINPNAVLASGGHDQYCAALGCGVTEPGDCLLSCGTAWVTLPITQELTLDPAMLVSPGVHTVPGLWGLMQSIPVAGAALRWFRDTFCEGITYAYLSDVASKVSPASDGMMFIPQVLGENGFHFCNATLSHSRDHFARAIMEGIVCRIRQSIDNLRSMGAPVNRLVMIGGGAKSIVWPQIATDLTGIVTDMPAVSEAACRGAAMLGGLAAGLYSDFKDVQKHFAMESKRVEMSHENRAIYNTLYEQFIRYVEQLGSGS